MDTGEENVGCNDGEENAEKQRVKNKTKAMHNPLSEPIKYGIEDGKSKKPPT